MDTNGKYVDENGYIKCYLPSHPWANHGYVHEHRLVAEDHIGFILDPSIVIHHIDFNKTHNVWSNLFITTQSEHTAIHNRNSKVSQAVKQKIREGHRKNRASQKSESN